MITELCFKIAHYTGYATTCSYCRADTSDRRMSESFGIMVNYEYQLSSVRENSTSYLVEHRIAVEPHIYRKLDLDPGVLKQLVVDSPC